MAAPLPVRRAGRGTMRTAMDEAVRQQRRAIMVLAGLVGVFILAGLITLIVESGGADTRPKSASEVAWDYVLATDRLDATAAAAATDNPGAAEEVLKKAFRALPDAEARAVLGEVKTAGDRATAEFEVTWTMGDGRSWSYTNSMELEDGTGDWRVRWTPALVHPDLEAGQTIKLVTRTNLPAVLDADGKPMLIWRSGYPLPVEEKRARLVLPAMTAQAQKQGEPGNWGIAAVTESGKEVKILPGRGPDQMPPLKSTLRIAAQDAAQRAVDGVKKPAALVALRPSTGGFVAIAQNEAADQGPIALSGLFPPGSTFTMATAAAAMENGLAGPDTVLGCPRSAHFEYRTVLNDRKLDLGDVPLRTAFARDCKTTIAGLAAGMSAKELVAGADVLGMNADFEIPGISTEAGAARPTKDVALRVDDAIGQGTVHASPFGVALMSATVAAGKPVTPQLWADQGTKVLKGYDGPAQGTIDGLRVLLREAVTAGAAKPLAALGDVHGLAGKSRGSGTDHGWFTGFHGDLAFAVLVAEDGSADEAVAIADAFLRSVGEA